MGLKYVGEYLVISCDGDGEVHDREIPWCPPSMEMEAKKRGWDITYHDSQWPVRAVCPKCRSLS